MEEPESGFVGEIEVGGPYSGQFTGVEVLRVSQVNVFARGKRYGRLWFLKGLSPEMRHAAVGRQRLMKEFEIQARLCHPAVVQAVSIEEVEGLGPCIVMEWVEGKNLSELLLEGKLTSSERRRIMREIVIATNYLHRNGIAHRDLKPTNIMVRNAGQEVVIIDFGLADTHNYYELKQPAGTPGFISEEQLERGGTDTADDIYSLGVIMNELCPGQRRLSRRCRSPRGKRPANAEELLKIMDRSKRRRKFFLIAGISAVVLAGAAISARQISRLEATTQQLHRSSRQSNEKVEILLLENKRNEEYTAQLSDSLTKVHSRMEKAEAELNKTLAYTQLYEKLFKSACARITAKFEAFEKKMDPSSEPHIFSTSLREFDKGMYEFLKYEAKGTAKSGLKEIDAKRMEGELQNYFISEAQKYYPKWNNQNSQTTK